MRVVEYDAYGPIDRLVLRDAPMPETPSDGVRVRVTRAALNPKDALVRKGKFAWISGGRFPKRTGLDFAGVVEETETPRLRPGQRIFGALEELTARRGTVAEIVTCRSREVTAIPDRVDDDAAAAIPLAGLTALQALRDLGRVREASRVLVHGASGGVGTLAIQVARRLGARVETTSSPRNFELCARLGAEKTWDYATSELAASDPSFDVVFDVFGNLRPPVYRRWLAAGGAFVTTIPSARSLLRDVGTRLSAVRERLVLVRSRADDLDVLACWLAEGKLEAVIDSRFPLARVHEAFQRLESKHARGKILIDVSGR